MVQAGWLATGKMVIYPMRNDIDGEGRQLVNWVAEIETPRHQTRDGTGAARSPTFSASTRIGVSTGSTCRR
jgi:5-methylphenazine-1-carboxylate 1-monooxygenase